LSEFYVDYIERPGRPSAVVTGAFTAANATAEFGGWVHRGWATIPDGTRHSVWHRPGEYATTLGRQPPALDQPIWGTLGRALEVLGSVSYRGN
jgi:hypothetical protein